MSNRRPRLLRRGVREYPAILRRWVTREGPSLAWRGGKSTPSAGGTRNSLLKSTDARVRSLAAPRQYRSDRRKMARLSASFEGHPRSDGRDTVPRTNVVPLDLVCPLEKFGQRTDYPVEDEEQDQRTDAGHPQDAKLFHRRYVTPLLRLDLVHDGWQQCCSQEPDRNQEERTSKSRTTDRGTRKKSHQHYRRYADGESLLAVESFGTGNRYHP